LLAATLACGAARRAARTPASDGLTLSLLGSGFPRRAAEVAGEVGDVAAVGLHRARRVAEQLQVVDEALP
jgi:hypothetical protein